jgi:sec-independent protein translocase protein TatA
MELFTPGHLLVLAIVVAVLFFGWKQLPDMARSLGRSLRIFKTEIKGMSEDDKKRADAHEAAATAGQNPPPAVEGSTAQHPAVPAVPPVPPVPSAEASAAASGRPSQPVVKPSE